MEAAWGGSSLAFILLAFITLMGAVLAMQLERVVHIVMAIAATMIGIAGLYLFLNATFLALVQLLLYAGAVSIIMLFSIMLTSHSDESAATTTGDVTNRARWPYFVFSSLFFLALAAALYSGPPFPAPEGAAGEVSLASIGQAIFQTYSLPLEALSILLLAAVVGAVALTRPEREE